MALIPMLAHAADVSIHQLPIIKQIAIDHLHQGTHLLGKVHNGAQIYLVDTTITPEQYQEKLKNLTQESQGGWLANAAKYFIGIFQKGGEVFMGFVTGIIPTLVVLMTAFYAVTGLIGEDRVHGLARWAGKTALTRYTLLPLISVFFLTNPMAYTFGSFLEEKHKPAFYDSAVSYVHPPLGLFPHVNPGEYFVWGGVLVALLELEKNGKVPAGYHIQMALWYAIVGMVVILLKGILTERLTMILARRQGVDLDNLS